MDEFEKRMERWQARRVERWQARILIGVGLWMVFLVGAISVALYIFGRSEGVW